MAVAADPWSAFAGNFGAGLGSGLGSGISGALGGDAGPFIGGSSSANTYGTTQDGSGWIVNIGGQQSATSTANKTTSPNLYDTAPQMPGVGMQSAGASGVGMLLMVVVIAGMLLARKRGR
ncbi:hypothetical protein [Piscinibacter sp.]|uniref:hypothetical protein n=1 Tax=Piscinibacter sp. TaxID=1903157 RepID=UPI0039E69C44